MSEQLRGVPTPPAGRRSTQLPFRPGVISKVPRDQIDPEAAGLTDLERKVLSQAGWKPGDPIPNLAGTQLSKRLLSELEKTQTAATDLQNATPVPPDTPPLQVPKPRELSDLSPEELKEVQAALAQAKAANIDKPTFVGSGVSQAYATAADEGLELVDDISTPQPTEDTTFDPTPKQKPSEQTFNPVQEEPVEPPSQQADESLAAAPQANVDNSCPRCGYVFGTELAEATDEDKRQFLQAVLGGKRFTKEVYLFGGRIRVVFRSMTPSEREMAYRQVDAETAAKDIVAPGQYVRHFVDYALVISLAEFQRLGQAEVKLAPVNEMSYNEELYKTPLPQLLQYVHDKLFVVESIRRAVGLEFTKFQRLQELLEVKADDPDFWVAIENAG